MEGANKSVHCECGYEARADDEDALLGAVRKHALEAHDIEFTREDALLVVLRCELTLPPEEGANRR